MIVDVKRLDEMELEEYLKVLQSGMFWEWYPSATGNYEEDTGNERDEKTSVLGKS